LCALGSFEPAALLIGRADASVPERVPIDWLVEQLAATDAALLENLGGHELATLAERGAALEIGEAVAYLLAEAERVLATP
jgi:hypothetical protein